MKFKEIKPDMVIHCPTEEDAMVLLKYLDSLGYRWGMTHKNLVKMPCWNTYTDKTCYMIEDNKTVLYGYLPMETEITEFSDLIEPDDYSIDITGGKIRYGGNLSQLNNLIDDSPVNSPIDSPMTAEKVLEWFTKTDYHMLAEVFDGWRNVDDILGQFEAKEIVAKITAYEVAKKAPKPVKVKEGYYCDIYTEDEQILNYIMYGVDEQTATADAREKAIQNTMETGSRTFADVKFVCEEDES